MNKKTIQKPITPKEFIAKNLNIRNLTLPSGIIVKVKNIDLETMLTQNYIPLRLFESFTDSENKVLINQSQNKSELSGISDDKLKDIDSLCRSFSVFAVIEPKLSIDKLTSEESINVYDLNFTDCMFIFTNCTRGKAINFAPFREKQQLRNNAGQTLSEIPPETVVGSGNTEQS